MHDIILSTSHQNTSPKSDRHERLSGDTIHDVFVVSHLCPYRILRAHLLRCLLCENSGSHYNESRFLYGSNRQRLISIRPSLPKFASHLGETNVHSTVQRGRVSNCNVHLDRGNGNGWIHRVGMLLGHFERCPCDRTFLDCCTPRLLP